MRAGVHSPLATYAERIDVVDVGGPGIATCVTSTSSSRRPRAHEGDGKDLETAVRRSPVACSRCRAAPAQTHRPGARDGCDRVDRDGRRGEVATVRPSPPATSRDGSQADLDNQADRRRQLGRDVSLSPREAGRPGADRRGRSNDEVAEELYLSINTVKSLDHSTYRKIGVSSRTQAVAWGVEHGFPTTGTIDG